MKNLLFLATRTKRSAATLEKELDELEPKLGIADGSGMECGDLVFWPISTEDTAEEFRERHRALLGENCFIDWFVVPVGQGGLYAASQSRIIDEHNGERYAYGDTDEPQSIDSLNRADEDEEAWWEFEGYERPQCTSDGLVDWLRLVGIFHEPPTFQRKLLVILGRGEDGEGNYLDTLQGQKLLSKLSNAKVVLRADHADAAVVAFEHGGSAARTFEVIKQHLRPRLVEDAIILCVDARNYSAHDDAWSLFAQWAPKVARTWFDQAHVDKSGEGWNRIKSKRRRVIDQIGKLKLSEIRPAVKSMAVSQLNQSGDASSHSAATVKAAPTGPNKHLDKDA